MSLDAEHRRLRAALRAELPAARALRRDLHAEPYLSGKEEPTTTAVLDALGVTDAERVADTGAMVRVGGDGPAVGVRGELDALPILEATGVPWASTNGAMHACGHDVHLAALVALARTLRRVEGPAPIVAVLQPREETYPSGALDVVTSGALTRHDVRAMVAAHVQPVLAEGEVACAPGAVNASADEFTVTVRGNGGHAAYPHLSRDPVLALAQVIVAAQQLVSRDADPMIPAVVTFGALSAGTAANATPQEAVARGTLRTLAEGQRDMLHTRLREVAEGVATAHGCRAAVEIVRGEPVLDNDPVLAMETARLLSGAGHRVSASLRSCGADDFAYFAADLPALMMFVGTGTGGDPTAGLHSPAFLPSDATVDTVAEALLAAYLAAARTRLGSG